MTTMKKIVAFILFLTFVIAAGAQDFRINDSGYFNHEGVDAMAFDDFYPEGHQGGISFIMNGKRVATNGDIRFDETPGQWQPVPRKMDRIIDGQKKYRKQCAAFAEALKGYARELEVLSAETPYGVPYRPNIWGAGWDIQAFGYRHYFLAKTYPDIFSPEQVYNALNFILGCHPGLNVQSFASGVGAKSATVGYGLNRADWSYIPGGVVSGTALIRPDFPELLVFPFLWQQVEYVLGGGSSHYMFLVLAAKDLMQ